MEELLAQVLQVKVNFPELIEYTQLLQEARELKTTITAMLVEDKVSLTAMREVMAKIEVFPVNFELEVDAFQKKMLSAQSWLAKVRKCIPKRRGSRRGATEPKKMDLNAIRALVDDAPCEDSAEMFEMQDLLECADEWAEKVRVAIEGGTDVSLESLKELVEEGREMPVDIDEQQFLEAEIATREWCVNATTMLSTKKPLKELEEFASQAKLIRKQLHPKKQARWKPQIERDIHTALEVARRWVNEVKDVIGTTAFDKLFVVNSSYLQTLGEAVTASDANTLESTEQFIKGKKTIESVLKLVDKAEKLGVDVRLYLTRLQGLLTHTYAVQQLAVEILVTIGVHSTEISQLESKTSEQETTLNPEESTLSDSVVKDKSFAYACGVLDRIALFPIIFDEGVTLHQVIQSEKTWAVKVREALPPRQSRKKRQTKDPVTLDHLQTLLQEASTLRFQFPEERKILTKELEEVALWQEKARQVVEVNAVEFMQVAKYLQEYDFKVYGKVCEAKNQLKSY